MANNQENTLLRLLRWGWQGIQVWNTFLSVGGTGILNALLQQHTAFTDGWPWYHLVSFYVSMLFVLLGITIPIALHWKGKHPQRAKSEGALEFYPNRSDMNEKRGLIAKEISTAEQVWLAAPIGTSWYSTDFFVNHQGKIKKLVLHHPDAELLSDYGARSHESVDEYRKHILENTKTALDCKVRVWWTKEQIPGMVIANPEKGQGTGWARMEIYHPWHKAEAFPSYVAYEGGRDKLFAKAIRAYEELTGQHKDPRDTKNIANNGKLIEVDKQMVEEMGRMYEDKSHL